MSVSATSKTDAGLETTTITPALPKQLVIAAMVAAAWLVIALLYLAGVAVLVPPLLLIGTAALLRAAGPSSTG